MLTTNLWKESGLVNGAQGKIHKIIYMPGSKPPEMPCMVLVEIPQYLGPSIADIPHIVPIVPITRQWFKDKTSCTRKALPLVPSYSITIHKSPGASLDSVIINFGQREFAIGLTYTALSRCKTLEQLYIDGELPKTRLTNHFKHQLFKKKQKEEKRLKAMEEKTLKNANIEDVETDDEEEMET